MFSIDVVDSYEKFMQLEAPWNELLVQSDTDNPFMTFEWFSSWWESYGGQKQMLVLLVRDDDTLVAIAPFMLGWITWHYLPVRAITFIGNYITERSGILMKEADSRVLTHLFNYLRSHYRYDMIIFDHIVKGSMTDVTIDTLLREKRMRYLEMRSNSAPFIEVNGNWDEYYKNRPKNFRSRMNNIGNLLKRAGVCEIVCHTDDPDHAMEDVLRVSLQTWKNKRGTAIASAGDNTKFYSLLARRAAEKGWLNVWVLKLDDKPIAFTFNLNRKGKVFGLKSGYDEAYHRMAPSRFLNNHTVKDCFVNRSQEYDLLGKSDSFKMKWASKCRDHGKYVIFNDTFYGRGLHFLETVLVQRIKQMCFGRENAVPGTALPEQPAVDKTCINR